MSIIERTVLALATTFGLICLWQGIRYYRKQLGQKAS
jgi:hypothetical protein